MLPVVLFIFFSTLLGTMVFFRVWELRNGRFDLKEVASRELTFSEAHLEHINNKFLDLVKYAAHMLTVVLVRLVIGLLFVIRRESRRLATKLDHFFLQPHGLPSEGPASYFLRDIAAYKERLRSLPPAKEEE